MESTTLARVVLSVSIAACVAGCGSAPATSNPDLPAASGSERSTIELLADRSSLADVVLPEAWRTVFDVVPVAGEASDTRAALLAIGTVVATRPGPSYAWPNGPQVEGGPPTEVRLEPGDNAAAIDTVLVDLAVSQGVSADGVLPGTLTFSLSFLPGVDAASVQADLADHDAVAVLLRRGPAADATPGVWDVFGFGDFLGLVDAGQVTFPLAGGYGYPQGFIPPGLTMAALLERSS